MSMLLYAAPGTCARVAMIALEEAGAPYDIALIRFLKGEHRAPGFLAVSPLGKVPALVVDGEALTENVALITYLNERFPDAALLPEAGDPLARARRLADLCFCSSTLHPLVTRIRMPQFFVEAEQIPAFHARACEAMRPYVERIESRLAEEPWWFGRAWSAMDAYLYWVFWRVRGAGFEVAPFPRFTEHAERMEDRPAVRRALAREAEMERTLEAEGLSFRPPAPS